MAESEKFSIRVGIEKPIESFQVDSMDDILRTALYNDMYAFLYLNDDSEKNDTDVISKILWSRYFNRPIDEYTGMAETQARMKNLFTREPWYTVYNFLERLFEILRTSDVAYDCRDLASAINYSLQENRAGYILHKWIFIPITHSEEVKEITELAKNANKSKLPEVRAQLELALKHLSLKPQPDLAASIKNSISMVGTVARMIGDANDLGRALTLIQKKNTINPQILQGFKNLYNFTNQDSGIRHELMGDSNLDLATARYFLVSCSAFTNYLISEGTKAGVIKQN